MRFLLAFCFFFLSAVTLPIYAQDHFYNPSSIQKIEIFFSQPDWNHQMHVLKITTEGYLKADSAKINGTRFVNVGVKYKGNSSYDSNKVKNPLHIALDKYENQDYQGYNDIKLSNCYQDPSMIREVLSYQILSYYMECPKSNFALVYINGDRYGLYSNVEDIGKTFCANRFHSVKTNTFFKCSPLVTPGPNTKSNLKYLGADSTLYANYYEIKSSKGWNHFVQLCSTATLNPSQLSQELDLDRFNWMLAFDNVLVNLDSYMGAFSQNYYLFRDDSGVFNPIIWDLNMAFAGFPFAGSGNSSLGTLSISNAKQFPINIHQTDPYWPVINAVHSSERLKKMYQAHLRSIVIEIFSSGYYDTLASKLMNVVDTAVASDPHKFFSYSDFQNSMTTDISVGTYLVPGIRNLMAARTAYLLARPEIAAVPPALSNPTSTFEEATGEIWVTATLSNHLDTAVYLGFRTDSSKRFTRIRMYDDGLHNDGMAGDQVYGASFSGDPYLAEIYFYAENAEAGAFLPERAEFEFYRVSSITSLHSLKSAWRTFSLYPNPTKGVVNLKAPEPIEIFIFDAMGRRVLTLPAAESHHIDVRNWKPGVYFVRDKISAQKFVLEN